MTNCAKPRKRVTTLRTAAPATTVSVTGVDRASATTATSTGAARASVPRHSSARTSQSARWMEAAVAHSQPLHQSHQRTVTACATVPQTWRPLAAARRASATASVPVPASMWIVRDTRSAGSVSRARPATPAAAPPVMKRSAAKANPHHQCQPQSQPDSDSVFHLNRQ